MGNLDRLKQEGAAKLAEAEREARARQEEEDAERRVKREHRLRLAVGRYHHRAIRNVLFWASVPWLAGFAIGIFAAAFDALEDVWGPLLLTSAVCLFGGLWLWGSELVWRASASVMRAEQQWIHSRPFALVGYLEWLTSSSSNGAYLRLDVRGPGLRARKDELRTLVAAVHAGVKLENESRADGVVHLLLSEIPSGDDDQRARVVHDLVDRVLVPLHHESAIESVTLRE